MEFYRSKMLPFEKKYNISLQQFKQRFDSKTKENLKSVMIL